MPDPLAEAIAHAQALAEGGSIGAPAVAKEPASPMENLAGYAAAGATGIRSGLESIPGIGGNIAKGQRWLTLRLAKLFNVPPEVAEKIAQYGGYLNPGTYMPSSTEVAQATDPIVNAISPTAQAATRHQAATPGERVAEEIGNFAGAAAMPVGEIGLPAEIATRGLRVAAPVAATEAAGAGGEAMGLDPEDTQALQVLAAGVAGGGAGAFESLGKRLAVRRAAAQVNSNPAAVKAFSDILLKNGVRPEDIAARMRELGVEAIPADVDPNLMQKTAKIQAEGGAGRGVIDPFLRERNEGANPRLETQVEQTYGPRQQPTDVVAALEQRKETLGPAYEEAHRNQTSPADTQPIIDAIDSDLAVVKSPEVINALQRIRTSLHLRGTDQLDPSSEGLHQARQAIDNELYGADGRPRDIGAATARVLNRYRQQIDQALENVGPIKDVDRQYHQIGQEERAFDTGQRIYENPRGAPTEVEFQRAFNAMTPGEQQHVLSGANVETYRQLGINSSDLNKLRDLIKGEGKWNAEKVATVVGRDRAEALMRAIERERTYRETYQRVVQGSKTAETAPGGEGAPSFMGAAAKAAPDIGVGAYFGGAGGAGIAMLSNLRRYALDLAKSRGNAGADPNLARLLISQQPGDLVQAIQTLRGQTPSVAPQAAISALLARRQDLEQQKER